MPQNPEARSLRNILSQAGQGKTADQAEVSAAVGRSTQFLIPIMVFLVALRLAVALPLYWLVSSLVAYIQQSRVLREDAAEADASVNVESTLEPTRPKSKKRSSKKSSKSKRRKR